MYTVCNVIYADKELGRAGVDGWKFTEYIVLPQFAATHPGLYTLGSISSILLFFFIVKYYSFRFINPAQANHDPNCFTITLIIRCK